MFTDTIFEVNSSDSNSVTFAILRRDPTYTLDQLKREYAEKGLRDDIWGDRRTVPSEAGNNPHPFTLRVPSFRCALVTNYNINPPDQRLVNQLVIVFGPPSAASSAGSSGGAKRKRVISRKLKSLNKKRKYTQRRFRRRYSYKGGRKN